MASYDGDASFLSPPTQRTRTLLSKVNDLIRQEKDKGVLDVDVKTPSTIVSHQPGYIDKALELIVGLQVGECPSYNLRLLFQILTCSGRLRFVAPPHEPALWFYRPTPP
jgi:formate C-acetyltransferase